MDDEDPRQLPQHQLLFGSAECLALWAFPEKRIKGEGEGGETSTKKRPKRNRPAILFLQFLNLSVLVEAGGQSCWLASDHRERKKHEGIESHGLMPTVLAGEGGLQLTLEGVNNN